jgi:D-glycero-D-manno-heptose 1,7-bisphosphate phosphatase
LIVVTNQPDVARGDLSRATAEAINRALLRQLPVDAILACFHDDVDDCECRKPKPGLLVQAASEMGLNLDASFMVGDRWRDTGAGRRAGCTTIQIRTALGERSTEGEPDFWVACLPEAATLILEKLRLQRI